MGFDLVPFLLPGLWVTLQATAAAAALGLVAAFAAGLARQSRWMWLSWPAVAYIELFRGTSALVQLFWFYFALPLVGIRLDAMFCAILVLGLNTGAYGAEVVRGAVAAVPRGQREAGIALNFTPFQHTWLVIVPQALRAMVPPFGNLTIELLKNTALLSLVTLHDLTFRAQALRADTLRTTEIFGLVLLIYFAVSLAITGFFRLLERRLSRGIVLGGR